MLICLVKGYEGQECTVEVSAYAKNNSAFVSRDPYTDRVNIYCSPHTREEVLEKYTKSYELLTDLEKIIFNIK